MIPILRLLQGIQLSFFIWTHSTCPLNFHLMGHRPATKVLIFLTKKITKFFNKILYFHSKTAVRCYDLPQNPVLELRKWCINQDETGFLLPLPTTIYTKSDLVPSSLHCVIISCPPRYTTSLFCHETRRIRYITLPLGLRLCDIGIRFPR